MCAGFPNIDFIYQHVSDYRVLHANIHYDHKSNLKTLLVRNLKSTAIIIQSSEIINCLLFLVNLRDSKPSLFRPLYLVNSSRQTFWLFAFIILIKLSLLQKSAKSILFYAYSTKKIKVLIKILSEPTEQQIQNAIFLGKKPIPVLNVMLKVISKGLTALSQNVWYPISGFWSGLQCAEGYVIKFLTLQKGGNMSVWIVINWFKHSDFPRLYSCSHCSSCIAGLLGCFFET